MLWRPRVGPLFPNSMEIDRDSPIVVRIGAHLEMIKAVVISVMVEMKGRREASTSRGSFGRTRSPL